MATTESTPKLDSGFPSFTDVCAGWHKAAENIDKFHRALTTDAKIAQTPRTLVWTLNKAKLYRYVPVVPEEERKPSSVPDGLRDHESASCA